MICINILHCGNCVFVSRAVFGYDGKTNDLKVAETGGMSHGSFLLFSNILIVFKALFFCYDTENISRVILYVSGEFSTSTLSFKATICLACFSMFACVRKGV